MVIIVFAAALTLSLINSLRFNAMAPTWRVRVLSAGLSLTILALTFGVQYTIVGHTTPLMVPTAFLVAALAELARLELVRRNRARS